MKKIFIFLPILILSLFFLSSCLCDKVTIELNENPTTGYIWTYNIEGDGDIELIKDKFDDNKKDEKLVGKSGVHSFTFKAIKDGQCIIKFKNVRPWEDVPLETKLFKLEIKNKHFVNL